LVTLDSGEVITRSWTYDHDMVASEQVVSSAAPANVFRTEYTYFYDADGRPTNVEQARRRKDDGSFQTTSYTYDTRGRVLTTTFPDGVKLVNEYTGDYVTHRYFEVGGSAIPQMDQRFEYNAKGQLIKQWDARNNLTQLDYDNRSRLTTITNPLGEQTLFTYADNLLAQIDAGHTAVDGEGQVTKLIYDTRGRLTGTQRKNDAGVFEAFESYELDSEGRRLSTTDAINRKTKWAYDLLGRIVSVTDPLNKVTQTSYDAPGNLILSTDALGRQTAYEYDDLNRRVATVESGVSPNPRTEFTYDAAGNLTSVKDGENQTTSYAYDALSRNTRVTQPLGQYVEYVYDDRDRIDYSVMARGQKIDYAYAAWGPVQEEKQYPTTSAVTPDRTIAYTYDNDGNLTAVSDSGVQPGPIYSLTYDSLGRAYDEAGAHPPGGSRMINYRYDRYGNCKEVTLQDGTAVTQAYTFNKLNRLASANLAGASIALSYLANDARQSIALPGGVSRGMTYKANGPIDAITVSGPGGSLAQFTYTYDDVLNVDTLTDGDGLHDYGHDGLNRLTSAVRPSGLGLPNESYAYDRAGNREDVGNPALYAYDANNRISASPGLTYTHDADGNLVSRSDGAAFTYDARNRLIQYAKSGITAAYLQDPLGRRIRKTVNGVETWFLWGGSQLLAEYDGIGARKQRYGYIGSDHTPVQVADANGTYYVQSDRLGAPRLLTDSSAQIVWKARYEAFGKAVVDADPDGNLVPVNFNARLPGQMFDAESGLYDNYFRDYDPAIGRYIESDPIGLDGGINTYLYARANPLSRIDPTGEDAIAIPVPRPIPLPGWAGPAGAVAGAGWAGWQVGSAIYPHIAIPLGDAIDKMCNSKEKNCRALYDTIIRSCWSITNPRKRQRCFEAAKTSYEQCMAQD